MKQVRGKVLPSGQATLALRFRELRSPVHLEIDTGFDGTVLLPLQYAELLDSEFSGSEFFLQASGEPLQVTTSIAVATWFGKPAPIHVCFAATESLLIERKLFNACKLEIDFKKKTVIITA